MYHAANHSTAFSPAESLTATPSARGERQGIFVWLIGLVRRYLAARRTLRALDRLDEAMLKDIGFRRIPGEYSKYERLL